MAYLNGQLISSIVKVESVPLLVLLSVGDNLRGRTVIFNTSRDFVGNYSKYIITSHITSQNMKDRISSGTNYVNEMGYVNAGGSEGSAETHYIQKFTDEDGKWLLTQYTFPDDADIIIENIQTADFWNQYMKLAITIDKELDADSPNPVENKAITEALDEKASNTKVEELEIEVANLKAIVYDTVASVEEKTDNYADIVPIPDSVNLKPLIDNTLSQLVKIEGNSDVYMPNAPDLDDAVIIDSNITKLEAFSQLWDEQWVYGYYYNNNGVIASGYNTATIRCKNPIKVKPNENYYLKASPLGTYYVVYYLDKNNNIVKTTDSSPTITTTANTDTVVFFQQFNEGITYNNDISIYYGSTNRGYIPYRTKEIAINQTLKGAINAHDYIVFEEQENGTFNEIKVTNVESGDLGTLNWGYGGGLFNCALNNSKTGTNLLCSLYEAKEISGGSGDTDKTIYNYNGIVYVKDTSYTDATTFKNAMSGEILNYELATPTKTTLATGLTLDDVTLLVNKGGYIKVTETHQSYDSILWQTYGVNPNLTMAYIVKDFKNEE